MESVKPQHNDEDWLSTFTLTSILLLAIIGMAVFYFTFPDTKEEGRLEAQYLEETAKVYATLNIGITKEQLEERLKVEGVVDTEHETPEGLKRIINYTHSQKTEIEVKKQLNHTYRYDHELSYTVTATYLSDKLIAIERTRVRLK